MRCKIKREADQLIYLLGGVPGLLWAGPRFKRAGLGLFGPSLQLNIFLTRGQQTR